MANQETAKGDMIQTTNHTERSITYGDPLRSPPVNNYRSIENDVGRQKEWTPGDGKMSPSRRTFCLFTTFDLIVTFILWVIYTQLIGKKGFQAFDDQVANYDFRTSLFDTVMIAAIRFTCILLAYALFRLCHWWVIAITTSMSCIYLLFKCFYFEFNDALFGGKNPLSYILLIVCFILAWIETWFLDFKVIPVEKKARERAEETLSRKVSMVLDYLGFHPDIINWRRDNYEKRVEFINFCASSGQGNPPYSVYLTGSKEDGTSIWDAGDEDWMVEVDKFVEEKDNLFVYTEENLLPGYTKLQLATQRHAARHLFVVPFITPNGFVSSKLMNKAFYDTLRHAENCVKDTDFKRELYDGFRLEEDDSDNPKVVFAFQTTINRSWHTADIVPAFSYTSQDKYINWSCRTRQQRWPPQSVKEKVLQLPVHVVPKGHKGSESYDQEFRICYTYAEIELMKSLNETQTKVYVLLKLLFKSVINKKFPDIITSYVLKNVIFWISEQTPIDEFTNALLLHRFQAALKFIIQGIQEENLPNYFIPERNLLLGKIRPENKAQLIDLLSEYVSCGCNCVFKIPAIEQGLHAISKDDFEYSRIYRNHAELWLVYYQMYWCYIRESEIRNLMNILMNFLQTYGADE